MRRFQAVVHVELFSPPEIVPYYKSTRFYMLRVLFPHRNHIWKTVSRKNENYLLSMVGYYIMNLKTNIPE